MLTKVGKGKNTKYYIDDITGRRQISKNEYKKLSKILEINQFMIAQTI
jgi:hypothetical protein